MRVFVPGYDSAKRGLNWESKASTDKISQVFVDQKALARALGFSEPILMATTSSSGTFSSTDLPITVAQFHIAEKTDIETLYLVMWLLGVRWSTGLRNVCMKVYVNDEWLLTDGHGGDGGAEYCVAGFTPISPSTVPFDVRLEFDWLDTPPSTFDLRRGRYLILRARQAQRS